MTARARLGERLVAAALTDREAGCQSCGAITPKDRLTLQGVCIDCTREQWDSMSEAERATWCKLNKQHYPYVDKGPMSPHRLQRIGELLEAHPYRFAKTMPKTPHWYTLRYEWMDVGHKTFNEVVRSIREHGYTEWFGTYPWRMLEVGGFKYWSYYNSSVESVIVLNRKPLPVPVPEVEEESDEQND